MLAARASARSVQRTARSFATIVDNAGIKVAAIDHNQPTSAVTILVKAGSRFEPKPGVAHALKNFAFKSTAKRSALGTVRESELYGGALSASLAREHLALTAEFLRGDEPFFVDLLSSFITSAKFTRHEYEEYVAPLIEGDTAAANADPAIHAIELAHALAFRSGLGSSLFAPSHNSITAEDIRFFSKTAFTKKNIAVFGTGIDPSLLSQLVEKSLGTAPATAESPASATSYFGGETRVEAHGGPQTVFIGFGTASAPSAELAALAAHLSPQPSVKWSKGISPVATSIPEGTSVQSVYFPYSDAALVGLLVQGKNAAAVREAGKIAVKAWKGTSASGGVSAEDLKRAVAKAKFSAASVADSWDGLATVVGPKILGGLSPSLDASLALFDTVTASSFSKVAADLIKHKPTYVAIGDVHALPYADELEL